MSAPRCPRCAVAVEPFAVDARTTIDVCGRCNGAWFDKGELARVVGSRDDLLDPLPDDLAPAPDDAPSCPRCESVCMLRVPYAQRSGAPWVHRCPYCEGVWGSLAELPAMRALAGSRPRTAPRPAAAPATTPATRPAARADFVYDVDNPLPEELTFRQCLAALPVTFAVVAVMRSFFLTHLLLNGARVSLHELGHAVAGWACAWRALPLPIGLTLLSPGRHLGVYAACLALAVGAAWAGVRRKAYGLAGLAAGFVAVQTVCTWGLPQPRQDELVTFAGCGGEIALGALLVGSFFHRMPERMRWPRFRWVAMVIGACAFVDASLFWREAAADWDLIPWDAALADTGDMTKLVEGHGWNESTITRRYTALSLACAAALAVDMALACARARRRERAHG